MMEGPWVPQQLVEKPAGRERPLSLGSGNDIYKIAISVAQDRLPASAFAVAPWRTSDRKFRSPIERAGSETRWKTAVAAIFWTVDLYRRGRSLESCGPVHRNRDGFGCQTSFVRDAKNSLGVLSRLFLGAESLGLARLVTHCQEFDSIVSHMSIVALSEAWRRLSAAYPQELCPAKTALHSHLLFDGF